MTKRRAFLRSFLHDEAGAVTVEYVVLAAAVTGVALGSADVINRGLAFMAGTIDSELSQDETSGGSAQTFYDDGFDNGAAGWTGAAVADVHGLGNVLGPIGGSGGAASVFREFDIAPGTGSANFSFDLVALDTLDGESGIVYIDGREVGRLTKGHSETTFTAAEGLDAHGIAITGNIIDGNVHLGGPSGRTDAAGTDSRARISVTVKDPSSKVRFGFGSTADQGTDDESFAIDNFKATGTKGTTASPQA